jgi:hypothetical protein
MGTWQNGEEPTTNSPGWSELSGKRQFKLAMIASLSKRKQMTVVLLGDLQVVVKGETRAARHNKASWLVSWV